MILGVCQTPVLRSREELHPFIERAGALSDAAGSSSPGLFLLPELFWGGFDYENSESLVKETPELLSWLHGTAMGLNIRLAGSFWNQADDGPENAFFLLGAGLSEPTRIRAKAELFPVSQEEEHFVADATLPRTFDIGDLRCGAAICFELRFPEYFRYQVTQDSRGVDLMLLSSQWPASRADHLRTLTRARAIENQCYVLSCNCCGSSSLGALGGGSCLISPWGDVLFDCEGSAATMAKDFDPDTLDRARKLFATRESGIIALTPRQHSHEKRSQP